MQLADLKNITVLGAGIMGHGIAQGFLMGGYPVKLYDINQPALDLAVAHIRENLAMFAAEGMLRETPDQILTRCTTHVDLAAACAGADLVMEVIPEILELKQETFAKIEGMVSPECLLASNTSHLPLSRLFDRVQKRDRTLGAHYFNPPSIVPCVEIIKAEGTSDEAFQCMYDLIGAIGKEPVKVNQDIPGFVVNRVQTAVLREACDLVARGVASAEDMDKAIRASMGFRSASIGPLRMVDLGGVDAWEDCCAKLLPEMAADRQSPQALVDLVKDGHTGIRAGQGFYTYAKDFQQAELDEVVRQRDQEFLRRLKNLYWRQQG